ncbi:MAG: hypothetical protein K9N47_18310 [Prosthecobacter sp.]|nr:hypothetical protein [Prosthecobacter sp.]
MNEFVFFRDLPHQKMTVTALCVALFQSLDTIRESTLKHAPNEKRKLSRSILSEQVRSLLHESSQFMGKVARGAHGGIPPGFGFTREGEPRSRGKYQRP